MDKDGNGSLDFNEFVDYITGNKPEEKEVVAIPWAQQVPVPAHFEEQQSTIPKAGGGREAGETCLTRRRRGASSWLRCWFSGGIACSAGAGLSAAH